MAGLGLYLSFFWTSIKVRSIYVYLYSTFSQYMFESRKPCLNVLKSPVTVANVIRLGNGRKNLERIQAQLGESVLL